MSSSLCHTRRMVLFVFGVLVLLFQVLQHKLAVVAVRHLEVRRADFATSHRSNTRAGMSRRILAGKQESDSIGQIKEVKQHINVTTVFSTSCSPFQDWQSQALVHNHYQMKIPGDLVRLMSCDDPHYKLPSINASRYPYYRVIRTPDFNKLAKKQGHVHYTPRNRPASMEYWLGGHSQDSHVPTGHDHIVVAVDPDHLFLDSTTWDLSQVKQGHGVAALYAMGDSWVNEWAPRVCHPASKCTNWKARKINPRFGHPFIFTAQDALTHANVWINMTNEIKKLGHKKWESEMYSGVLSAIFNDIHVSVVPFMVSNPNVESEPWDQLQWRHNSDGSLSSSGSHQQTKKKGLPMLIGHYCQEYELSSKYSFFKHEVKHFDMRRCDKMKYPLEYPRSPSDQRKMKDRRNRSLMAGPKLNNTELAEVRMNRNVWMVDHVVTPIREALRLYRQDFCSDGAGGNDSPSSDDSESDS